LKSASRDGEPLDLDVAYDGETLHWHIDTSFNEIQVIENDAEMLKLLGDLGKVSIEAICQANGKSRAANDKVLKRLMDAGEVERTPQKVGYQTLYTYGLK
jgi:hypothetical protein